MKATTAHAAPVTIPITDVKAHTEAVTSHVAATTTHIHPFESTANAYGKWKNHFLRNDSVVDARFALLMDGVDDINEATNDQLDAI